MVFSYNWLKDYLKGRMPQPKKLAEILTRHSFEVSEVKKLGRDWILDVEVLPNRAGDCFSHLGIAREIAVVAGLTYCPPGPARTRAARGAVPEGSFSVEVKDKRACPRYTAWVIEGVKAGPSPRWLKERLRVCGLKSINRVVDIANYVMLETGQPLHVFDAEKLAGRKIIVRFAKKGERIVTLDGRKFNLDPNILIISDAKNPVAIAGIKGGKNPEVDKKTTRVVLESANFNSNVIRKGSKILGLRTDASLRFEHGLDPNLTEWTLQRTASLMGGRIAQRLDFYPQPVYPQRIKLDLGYVESLLGVKIPAKEIRKILEKLGFKIRKINPRTFEVEAPTLRRDVVIPEDLIEEIGRVYGYEKIPADFPQAALVPPKRNEKIFWENMVKDILKEAGFTEVYNYSFTDQKGGVEVVNPVSRQYRYLRESLTPGLMKNIQKNLNDFPEIRIFELGKVFAGRTEKTMLAGAIAPPDFYYLKGVIDLLLEKLGISNFWYEEAGKKSGKVKIDGRELGCFTENSFELNFDYLHKFCSEEHEYRPLSKYPASVRDLAVLVPRQTQVVEVLNIINAAGGTLVRDVDLFDIYEGEELPEDKKNLAFHIVYQSDKKTLTSEEVDRIHWRIIKALERNPLWQVRK